ncbi:MAG: hypothetical protein IKZ19_03675 [Clostridia bacterium]|nr:hypothetical protein [Clostridia bacterium]
MEQNFKNRSQIWRVKTIAVGAAAGVFSAVAVLAVFAVTAVATGVFSSAAKFAPFCVMGVCGLVSGAVSAWGSRKNPLPNGLISAGLGSAVLGLLALTVPREAGGSVWGIFISLCAGAAGAFLAVKLGKKGR